MIHPRSFARPLNGRRSGHCWTSRSTTRQVPLAHAIVASVSVIDFGAAVIDGGFPPDIRCRLVSQVRECVAEMDLRGLTTFEVLEGSVGANARAIGGACLPFFAKYLLNRDVLFKEDACGALCTMGRIAYGPQDPRGTI